MSGDKIYIKLLLDHIEGVEFFSISLVLILSGLPVSRHSAIVIYAHALQRLQQAPKVIGFYPAAVYWLLDIWRSHCSSASEAIII